MRSLLASNPALTAILCVNDLMAVGELRELRDCGIRVPQDVSRRSTFNATKSGKLFAGL